MLPIGLKKKKIKVNDFQDESHKGKEYRIINRKVNILIFKESLNISFQKLTEIFIHEYTDVHVYLIHYVLCI